MNLQPDLIRGRCNTWNLWQQPQVSSASSGPWIWGMLPPNTALCPLFHCCSFSLGACSSCAFLTSWGPKPTLHLAELGFITLENQMPTTQKGPASATHPLQSSYPKFCEPLLPVNKSWWVFKWQFPVERKTETHHSWKAFPRKDQTGASKQLFTELSVHFSKSFFFFSEKTGLFPASELKMHFLLWNTSFKGKKKLPNYFNCE